MTSKIFEQGFQKLPNFLQSWCFLSAQFIAHSFSWHQMTPVIYVAHLHVIVNRYIGVGTGKLLGLQRIFARIFPNLPETFLCDFSIQIFSHKDQKGLFLMW